MNNRIAAIRSRLADNECDGILISNPDNRRYLSGFTGSAGYLFISHDTTILATDFRYIEQATKQSPGFQVINIGTDWSWFVDCVVESEAQRVAFESNNLTVDTYQQIGQALQSKTASQVARTKLVGTKSMVEMVRSIKDAEELHQMQRAIDIADQALYKVTESLSAGETEQQIAWRLEAMMREAGADCPSFDTIVASGPNGAMPHHRPTDKPISLGEPIVIDMGAKVGGYCSDITRTVCAGKPEPFFSKIYDIVLGAQLSAIQLVRPGMTGSQADQLSRVVINESGYAEHFGHSLGHGIGLAVHEYPGVGPQSNNILEPEMVFTVEPGIYISDWGGVRIEDMVILEADGAKVLTHCPK